MFQLFRRVVPRLAAFVALLALTAAPLGLGGCAASPAGKAAQEKGAPGADAEEKCVPAPGRDCLEGPGGYCVDKRLLTHRHTTEEKEP